ncbi:uncharacterized protein A1O9_08130 [Exophiala aquamarina CBS 119918]|uniref:Tetratricopeptide repeat protein 1 n=1 Tax=Exophiala aquamarina CBS 119918 TaxID=1182545 RepID=A0A072PIP6_9EURO|nr:uncharacterized protein A1O9_08130 [Exophiala aquamarina CBS 119918]KEF55380.1 hypothetical protein A1O9_08130 [Exophiala aquamarina CBS 119918]
MSFKASGPKVRPDRVKEPPRPPSPIVPNTNTNPIRPSWNSQSHFHSRRSSSSSIASFHSARFSQDEESKMVASSQILKAEANTQFAGHDYSQAISTYDRALAQLPSYLNYEMAVLQSNIAACHLRLEQWKEAVQSCEKGLDGLEREMPTKPKPKPKKRKQDKTKAKESTKTRLNSDTESEDEIAKESEQQDDTIVELDSDQDEAAALASLNISDARKEDIHRIRTKLLLRRARGRSSMPAQSGSSTWANLSGALEDYKLLSTSAYSSTLPISDQKTVRAALVSLPPQIDKAKEKEVSEMMGKLKDLGNGILKPFGLSTNNFKVVQGEGGGYSLSFDSGGGGGDQQKK